MKNYSAHFWKPKKVSSGGVSFTASSTSRDRLFLWEKNPTIKKNITRILIVLFFINYLGCTSFHYIRIDDQEKIENAGEIRLTTVDNKEYILTNIRVQNSVLIGYQWVETEMKNISRKFSTEQILYIEVEEDDAESIIWLVLGTVGLLTLYGID